MNTIEKKKKDTRHLMMIREIKVLYFSLSIYLSKVSTFDVKIIYILFIILNEMFVCFRSSIICYASNELGTI